MNGTEAEIRKNLTTIITQLIEYKKRKDQKRKEHAKSLKTVIDEMEVSGATVGSFNGAADTFIHRLKAGPKTHLTFSLIW